MIPPIRYKAGKRYGADEADHRESHEQHQLFRCRFIAMSIASAAPRMASRTSDANTRSSSEGPMAIRMMAPTAAAQDDSSHQQNEFFHRAAPSRPGVGSF